MNIRFSFAFNNFRQIDNNRENDLMITKFKNIISLLLLLVFLLPTIVKLEHHHQHHIYQAKNEKQFRVFQDKCVICNFEFSVFLPAIENIELQNEDPIDCYSNNYKSLHICNLSQYSFALRAPPYRQI
jgi:hypothetical protein